MASAKDYLNFIKFSHTIFALPFAIIGYFIATKEAVSFTPFLLLKVVLCMVFARSAAMGFNRLIDNKYDKANSRTAERELPKGIISPFAAGVFVLVNCVLFFITTFFINSICFALSHIAILVVLGYIGCI